MIKQILLITILILLLLFRIQQAGGIDKPLGQDPELENLASNFVDYRNFLSENINQILPQPQAALLNGILLGVKSDLSSSFSNALRRTSTIHIVVVSGQNLTLLIGFVMSLVSLLGRKKTVILSLVIIVLYSLLTGLQIPVLRAALMVSLALIAQLFNRESNSIWLLIISGLLMLIYEPNWLLSVSFQLSFLATIGVIVLAPELMKIISPGPAASPPQPTASLSLQALAGAPRSASPVEVFLFKEDLVVSLAAQLLTWPIIAANFHQVSIVGILVNSLILWTVSPVMIFGLLALVISLALGLTLGTIFALIPGVLLTYFVYIVDFFNSLPWASLKMSGVSVLVWLGYYILLFGLFLFLKQRNNSLAAFDNIKA